MRQLEFHILSVLPSHRPAWEALALFDADKLIG